MLSDRQQQLFDDFYESTLHNDHLDSRTELLVGLSAAMAMICQPCTGYYLQLCRNAGISSEEVGEVLAKVMTVAAGQKRLQTRDVLEGLGKELWGICNTVWQLKSRRSKVFDLS